MPRLRKEGLLTTDQIIDEIIHREGGVFVDLPEDRGGPTKFGVTLTTLREWKHNDALTASDVEALGEPEARTIIRHRVVVAPGLTAIGDEHTRALVADMIM